MRLRATTLLAALILALAACVPGAGAETVNLPSDAASGTAQSDPLYQVACPAAGDCLAVGAYKDTSANSQALIETQAGGSWTPSKIPDSSLPNVSGFPPAPSLTSVSCVSVGNCVASDAYDTSSTDEEGLIDTDANGLWTPIAAPLGGLPSVFTNPSAELADIACPASQACVAVGNYEDANQSGEGLIETQSPSGWSATQAPAPAGTPIETFAPNFYDVECASAGNCAAIGAYDDALGSQQGLLESDTGGSWSATEVDLSNLSPAANPTATVYALSCPVAGACTAVGVYENSANAFVPFVVTQVAGLWQPAVALTLPTNASSTADPSGDPLQSDLFLNGLSCTAASDCTAVGSYDATSANNVEALTVSESAGVWGPASEVTLPSDNGLASNPEAALYSITCQAPGDCLAAGAYVGGALESVVLVARQSGGAWTTGDANLSDPYDASDASAYWASVACTSSGYCATAGYVADGEVGGTSPPKDAFLLDAPDAPTAPNAVVKAGQVTVTWAAPSDQGGLPVTGYTVTANDQTNPLAGGQTVSTSGSATSATFTGLSASDSYTFTVSAQSLLGNGLPATSGAPTPPPSTARISASLKALLKPRGAADRLRRLRHTHRYPFHYTALEAGRLKIRWYHEVSTRGHRRHRQFVASDSAHASTAGQKLTLSVRLAATGRHLVEHNHRLHLSSVVSFTGDGATVSRGARFTLLW